MRLEFVRHRPIGEEVHFHAEFLSSVVENIDGSTNSVLPSSMAAAGDNAGAPIIDLLRSDEASRVPRSIIWMLLPIAVVHVWSLKNSCRRFDHVFVDAHVDILHVFSNCLHRRMHVLFDCVEGLRSRLGSNADQCRDGVWIQES